MSNSGWRGNVRAASSVPTSPLSPTTPTSPLSPTSPSSTSSASDGTPRFRGMFAPRVVDLLAPRTSEQPAHKPPRRHFSQANVSALDSTAARTRQAAVHRSHSDQEDATPSLSRAATTAATTTTMPRPTAPGDGDPPAAAPSNGQPAGPTGPDDSASAFAVGLPPVRTRAGTSSGTAAVARSSSALPEGDRSATAAGHGVPLSAESTTTIPPANDAPSAAGGSGSSSTRIAAAAVAAALTTGPRDADVGPPLGYPDEVPATRQRARRQLQDLYPKLLLLVESGDLAAVEAELRQRPDCVRERSKLGWTALHAAARAGASTEMAARLLAAGVDLEIADNEGNTPLLVAASYDRVAILELYLASGANPDRRNNKGRSLLQEALFHEAGEAFAWILARSGPGAARQQGGEAINAAGPAWWRTSLLLAITEAVDVDAYLRPLLAAGADPLLTTDIGQSALQYAILCDHVSGVRALLHADPTLAHRPLPASWARMPLNLAVAEGKSVATVRALLDAGANPVLPDINGHTALELAIVHGDESGRLLQTLLVHPASAPLAHRISTAGGWWRTPLHLAACHDQPAHIRLLARAGVALNAEDTQGRTALVVALVDTRPAAFAALCALPGVDLNHCAVGKAWRYPLHAAIAYGSYALLPELLRHVVDVTLRDGSDRTAAEFAVAMGAAEAVRLLVPTHVSPSFASAPMRRTLLHVAVLYNKPEMLRLLLDLGADPRAVDAQGRIPLLLAQLLGLNQCADALNDHHVKAPTPSSSPSMDRRRRSGDTRRGSFETGAARGSFERARSSFEQVRTSIERAVGMRRDGVDERPARASGWTTTPTRRAEGVMIATST